jgi:hypothetical protein
MNLAASSGLSSKSVNYRAGKVIPF